MVRGSGVSAELDLSRLPVFGVVPACLENDILSGAIERNASYAMGWVHSDDPEAKSLNVLYDPQTSGGLLVALPPERARSFVAAMLARGHAATSVIGTIVARQGNEEGRIIVKNTKLNNLVGSREGVLTVETQPRAARPTPAPVSFAPCCDAEAGANAAQPAADAFGTFMAFMGEANRAGSVDARTKKLIAVALSVSNLCLPCFKVHVEKAIAMGITRAEIDEVAKLATAFGGCTAMMFYRDACREVGINT
jgi:AhpD family alkylhydroperoxidase